MLQIFSILASIMLYFPSVQASPCVPGYVCDLDAIISETSCEYIERGRASMKWWYPPWWLLLQSENLNALCSLIGFNITTEIEINDELAIPIIEESDPFSREKAEDRIMQWVGVILARKCGHNITCKEQYSCESAVICRPRPPEDKI